MVDVRHKDSTGLHSVKATMETSQKNDKKPILIPDPAIYIQPEIGKEFEALEREADLQAKQVELNECVEFIAQLVDMLKHNVILPKLQLESDWHDEAQAEFTRNKGTTGNRCLDDRVEKTAMSMGLSKEQWSQLLYINLTAGDVLELKKVTRSHMKKVHDMVSRLLDGEEKTTAFALIKAIEKFMPSKYYLQK